MTYVESIRVFVRTVELGSITAGGRDNRLTPAVASNRIRELEERLGVRLFHRTTRKLSPTEIGRIYYDAARRVLEAVDESEAAVASFALRPKGALKVAAPLGLGRRVLAPLIPAFHAAFPDIEIRLRLSDRKLDVLANRWMSPSRSASRNSTMRLRSILDCERVLCAAPSYLRRMGVPQTPEDLLGRGHNCLLLRFPGSREYYWTLSARSGPLRLQVRGDFDADDADVLTNWALEGAGIVNRPRYEVADHLAAGRLQVVLPETPPLPIRVACLHPHHRLQDPTVQLFVPWMADRIRARIRDLLAGGPGRDTAAPETFG